MFSFFYFNLEFKEFKVDSRLIQKLLLSLNSGGQFSMSQCLFSTINVITEKRLPVSVPAVIQEKIPSLLFYITKRISLFMCYKASFGNRY
jgi:hypothetical protein